MSKRKNQRILFVILAIVLFLALPVYLRHWKENKNSVLPEKTEYLSEEYIHGKYLEDGIFQDVKFFPLASLQEKETFYFEESFGTDRTYGGDRVHEGTDIMTPDNVRGTYPVVSVCDGTVTNIGWLELGGYRVGITSDSGVYYYYAHLYRYDDILKEGTRVSAGQILGFAGDSGYGEEGTTGQFDVHLHFGIYLKDAAGNEVPVDPYPLLKNLRNKMLKYF